MMGWVEAGTDKVPEYEDLGFPMLKACRPTSTTLSITQAWANASCSFEVGQTSNGLSGTVQRIQPKKTI